MFCSNDEYKLSEKTVRVGYTIKLSTIGKIAVFIKHTRETNVHKKSYTQFVRFVEGGVIACGGRGYCLSFTWGVCLYNNLKKKIKKIAIFILVLHAV